MACVSNSIPTASSSSTVWKNEWVQAPAFTKATADRQPGCRFAAVASRQPHFVSKHWKK